MFSTSYYNDRIKKTYFFSQNELKFFYELKKFIKWKHILLFSKVRISDLVKNKHFLPKSEFFSIFWKASRKHIDYILTDYKWRILCAIELNGESHKKPNVVA